MATVNVNRSNPDQFYRYKMPKIIAKVEGKGNGIKTVIVNMPEIAKSLARPPSYPTKFFGCELGAQTTMDNKNERFIVNGAHDAVRLQDMLDGFIRKFVLCPQCDNPETNLLVFAKKQMISQRCIACGYNGPIDMRHKLTTFILKNPPTSAQNGTTDNKDTPSKKLKEKKSKRKDKENGSSSSPPTSPPQTPCEQNQHDPAGEDDDEDWGDDISEDAVAKRMQELSSGAKGLTLNDDMEKSQEERLEILFKFVKDHVDAGTLEGSDRDIFTEAERLDVRDKATLVLAELLFDRDMIKQIPKYRLFFLRCTHENKKAQKYLLGGFELLVHKYSDELLPKVAHLLKLLYDTDIVEEDVILEWGKKVSKKYVSKEFSQQIHDKASVFLKWLQEAEEEESSSEEEEEEVGIVYDSKARDKLSVEVTAPAVPVKQDGADDGDLDIDDI
ncbi:PREDICTED: eukaryotic translation initiation factor 5-like isoform X2 [Priapulus caudatus]|uniref:Eukaryotic translation initiation factor 5 n=1 Tax=Priapulus caudatus TaxID=37621 RepID=A0ABM1DTK0_PRICU|nr:PREDICTED: eukaryotic translation initiation factor 5-like isoform X2 [Priapulus caudatus]